MKQTLLILSLLISISHSALANNEKKQSAEPKEKALLFIGNSYTAGLKKAFLNILRYEKVKANVKFITKGAATMEDHASRGSIRSAIKREDWDYVILQGQSSEASSVFPPEPKKKGDKNLTQFEEFVQACAQLDQQIKKAEAQTMFFMTWAKRGTPDFYMEQRFISGSYNFIAKKLNAEVAPVGLVWEKIHRTNIRTGNKLFASDGSHASRQGSFASALTFYCKIYDVKAVDVKYKHRLRKKDEKIVKEAVDEVLAAIKAQELKEAEEELIEAEAKEKK